MSNTHTDILLAGAFAAFTVDLLIYPLDTLKTRFQSPDYTRLYIDASKKLDRKLFFRGLYQGVGSVILATIPSSGAFFTTYEATKSLLTEHNPTYNDHGFIPQPLIHAAASSTAEMVSCLILTPAEVLKQNAQMIDKKTLSSTESPSQNATMQALRRFQRPSQLWRGYTALVARNLPFTAMQFPMFEHLKQSLVAYRREQTGGRDTSSRLSLLETGLVTAVSAGSAGAVAAVVTTPVDVVKTRIMLSAGSSHDKSGKSGQVNMLESIKKSATEGTRSSLSKHKSSFDVAREVIKDSGWKGLMRGGTFRGVWTFLGSGLYLGVYETSRVVLEDRRADRKIRDVL